MAGVNHHGPGLLQLTELPPLSLYVHLPWCLRKCPYCDFNSHETPAQLPEREYLAALLADLEASLPLIWGRSVQTVFIGGGTPSLFSPEAIADLISGIRARLRLAMPAEITLEANPGTFERERFRAFRQAGVTRLSIGVQSFDDGLDRLKDLPLVLPIRYGIGKLPHHRSSFLLPSKTSSGGLVNEFQELIEEGRIESKPGFDGYIVFTKLFTALGNIAVDRMFDIIVKLR